MNHSISVVAPAFNEEKELEVHGLLFAVALVLEHQSVSNKNLYLPYKQALDIYSQFDGKQGKMYDNARLLPKLLMEKLK